MLEILSPGPLCTVQDRGRPGWGHLGVGSSGAADRPSYALANRLVGNEVGAAALEATFGGLIVRLRTAMLIAFTGAECAIAVTDGPDIGYQHPVAVPAGATVTLSSPRNGLRSYLAVRGGFDVPRVMDSRSTDLLSGLGPRPLARGDVLAIGEDPGTGVPTESAPTRRHPDGPILLWPGPRRDWFAEVAARELVTADYTVQTTSNRIGVRLEGPPLRRVVEHELPSEGIVEGAVQVPGDGRPLVFLADHPVTGGYPVIAVVDAGDIARVAQARPGETLRFRWHSPSRARE